MNSADYWEMRKAQQMWEYIEKAEETAEQIAKAYAEASNYLEKEIDKIYTRYKSKHGLSDLEARRLLQQMHDKNSFEELRSLLKQAKGSEKKELLAAIESPAYASRITQLLETQKGIDHMMESIYHQELAISKKFYSKLANEAYYKAIYNVQKDVGVAFSFSQTTHQQIDKVLKSKWSGSNYSTRIWNNTQHLADNLKQELLVSMMTGRSDREVSEIIRHRFGSGAMAARRLVRTESCYIANEMEGQAYEESGIEKYMFIATLDKKTSKICQEHDRKIYAVKDMQPGKNCPPMHPWCRSTTIAVIDDEVLEDMTRRARDPETGEMYEVPSNMSYPEWHDRYVNKGKAMSPYKSDLNIPFQKKKEPNIEFELKPHKFTNGTYDIDDSHLMEAKVYRLKNGCRIYIPNALDKTIQPINIGDMVETVSAMPIEITSYLKEIEIVDYPNPQDELISKVYNKKDFTSAAIGGNRRITFFPSKNNQSLEQIRNILYHESGHILEDEFFKEKGILISASKDYLRAMRLDKENTGNLFASKYAENVKSNREDLADSVRYYFLDKDSFKSEFKHRYDFIKEWMKWIQKK